MGSPGPCLCSSQGVTVKVGDQHLCGHGILLQASNALG